MGILVLCSVHPPVLPVIRKPAKYNNHAQLGEPGMANLPIDNLKNDVLFRALHGEQNTLVCGLEIYQKVKNDEADEAGQGMGHPCGGLG